MNATKRKFNALIQGIGTRSTLQPLDADDGHDKGLQESSVAATIGTVPDARISTDMATAKPMSSISADFLAKRRRLGALGSVTGNTITPGGKTTISNVTLKKWTASGELVRSQSKTEQPKYCPGDRQELIRRLGTFQELTEWTPKPDKVNEIEWAKRGWVCRGKDRVRCTLCNKELVVNTSKREVEGADQSILVGSEIEEALVKKFSELVVEAHQDDCLWRKRGCDDSLLRLQITSAQTALPALRQRHDELCARSPFLPYDFNLRLPPSLSLESVKSHLPPDFFTQPPPSSTKSTTPNDVALALALTGWEGLMNPKMGAVPNSATCATCLRRLGLWMFKSKEINEETKEILVPAPMEHLDPIREHRFFCPWRNPQAQRNSGSKANEPSRAAWEVLVLTVRNAAYLRGQLDRKDQAPAHSRAQSHVLPRTPTSRPTSHAHTPSEGAIGPPLLMLGPDMVDDEEEDEKARDAKDKERWARLRRVKSLFNTKGGRNRLSKSMSRPGTAKSTATGDGGKDPV